MSDEKGASRFEGVWERVAIIECDGRRLGVGLTADEWESPELRAMIIEQAKARASRRKEQP